MSEVFDLEWDHESRLHANQPHGVEGLIKLSHENIEAVARALTDRQLREDAPSMAEHWYAGRVDETWQKRLAQATVAISALNLIHPGLSNSAR